MDDMDDISIETVYIKPTKRRMKDRWVVCDYGLVQLSRMEWIRWKLFKSKRLIIANASFMRR